MHLGIDRGPKAINRVTLLVPSVYFPSALFLAHLVGFSFPIVIYASDQARNNAHSCVVGQLGHCAYVLTFKKYMHWIGQYIISFRTVGEGMRIMRGRALRICGMLLFFGAVTLMKSFKVRSNFVPFLSSITIHLRSCIKRWM